MKLTYEEYCYLALNISAYGNIEKVEIFSAAVIYLTLIMAYILARTSK